MKKLLVALLVIGLIVAVNVNVASANGGPHGGYSAATDECAGCHRAHTATNARLLTNTGSALCLSCHSGTGAETNVVDGRTVTGSNPLNAGGFTSAYNAFTSSFSGTTSTHDYADATGTAYQLTAAGTSLQAIANNLTCYECHDPHGSVNYRLIPVTAINATVLDIADYDTGGTYTSEIWTMTTTNSFSEFCSACHLGYHQVDEAAGSLLANFYSHRVDSNWRGTAGTDGAIGFAILADNPQTAPSNGFALPLAGAAAAGDNDTMICSTCHFSHGSSAAMGTLSEAATAGGLVDSSALLRVDNRGVCQNCHDK